MSLYFKPRLKINIKKKAIIFFVYQWKLTILASILDLFLKFLFSSFLQENSHFEMMELI